MSAPALTADEVERGYNNRAAVPDHPRWFARYAELSAAACARCAPRCDLRYGPGPKETLDLFVPAGGARATFVFLHGGYWRALDKRDFSFVAGPFVAAGVAVAVVNYDLCPDVSIATIVDECRARGRVGRRARERTHGAVPDRIVVGGHSAGGHLAAMMLATDWQRPRPRRRSDPRRGVAVRRPRPRADGAVLVQRRLSSSTRRRPRACRRSISRRARRRRCSSPSAATRRRSSCASRSCCGTRWPGNRPAGMAGPLVVPGRNHFSVVADYADPASALTRATLALF